MLLAANADLLSAIGLRILPKEEVSDGKATIHGIKEIAHLCVRPHERTLDVWQTDIADVEVVKQTSQIIIDTLEACFQFTHLSTSSPKITVCLFRINSYTTPPSIPARPTSPQCHHTGS